MLLSKEDINRIHKQLYGNLEDKVTYFSALGQLFVGCANVENAVHMLARKVSGLEEKKARIIFGGLRYGDLRKRISKMMEIDDFDKELRSRVENCLNQYALIDNHRDKMAHRMVSYHKGKIHVSDILTVKSVDTAENVSYDLKDFENMISDCALIYFRLETVRRPSAYIKGPTYRLKQIKDGLHASWRYKPSQSKTSQTVQRKAKKNCKDSESP
jgi:hypothetical protein